MNTLEKAVSRFLGWKLPKDFNPDCGISFIRESSYEHPEFGRTLYEPIGTNLFTAEQTKRMLEHVCEPLICALKERDAEIERVKVKETDWTAAYQAAYQEATGATVHASQLDTKLTAQCNVLEQALEALHDATWYVEQEDRAMDEYHSQHPWRLACEQRHKKEIERNKAAITAIQEILK
jgi:hypothetical protein